MYHDVFNFYYIRKLYKQPKSSSISTCSCRLLVHLHYAKRKSDKMSKLSDLIFTPQNVEIRKLWHDISRFFVQFKGKKILLKHRKYKVCLPFQLLEIETGRHSNCFFLFNQRLSIRSFGRRGSDEVGVLVSLQKATGS